MNWIKGNGVRHFAKLAMLLLLLIVAGVDQLKADEVYSNGTPYYANNTWYSLYYHNNSSTTKTTYSFMGDISNKSNNQPTFTNLYAPLTNSLSFSYYIDRANNDGSFSGNGYKAKWGDGTAVDSWTRGSATGTGSSESMQTWRDRTTTLTGDYTDRLTLIFYNDGSNTGAFINDVKIPLANHIRFNNNSTTYSIDAKTSPIIVGKPQKFTIPLRSFLVTSGSITITNSNSLFSVKDYNGTLQTSSSVTIAQFNSNTGGVCAVRNCTSGSVYGTNGRPGDAANYDIEIWFNPTTAGKQSATFDVYDGSTKRATITITAYGVIYNDGAPYKEGSTWYSLYLDNGLPTSPGQANKTVYNFLGWISDDSEATKNNKPSFPVYAPCNTSMSLKIYKDGTSSSGNYYMYDYPNGAKSGTACGNWALSGLTQTTWDSKNVTLSGNLITQVDFDYANLGSGGFIDELRIPLVNHIRLVDSSKPNVGNDNLTLDMTGTTTYIGGSQKITIPIRSFLINGDLKVYRTDGNSEVFRLFNSDYTSDSPKILMTNSDNDILCGIAGGSAGSDYSGASHHAGDASLINIELYYYPTSTDEQTCTLRIESGSTYATVIVKAKGTRASKSDGTKPYYNGSKWYSLYDFDTEYTLYYTGSTISKEFPVYSPCVRTLSFKYHYDYNGYGYLDLYNDGNQFTSEQFGYKEAYGDAVTATPPTDNITTLKFQRSNAPTLNVYLLQINMELACHVRLASGTYGTTSLTKHNFGQLEVGQTNANCTINVRSFLTEKNLVLKIKDGNGNLSTQFRIKTIGGKDVNSNEYTITNTANICGYSGAAAPTSSSPAIPINTDDMAIVVEFCPTKGGDAAGSYLTHNATLVFMDGTTERASVPLEGAAKKLTPDFAFTVSPNPITYSTTETYTYTAVSTNSTGAVTYGIAEGVATVGTNTGAVLTNAAGTFKIKAYLAATDGYYAAEVESLITVNPAIPDFAFVSPLTSIDYSSTADAYTYTAKSTASPNATVTYSIVEGTDVASVVENSGKVTTQKAGTFTIRATLAANGNYSGATVDQQVTVNVASPALSFGTPQTTIRFDETTVSVAATSTTNSTGQITYTSSNTSVATVDANGVITPVELGTFTVTATIAAVTGKWTAETLSTETLTIVIGNQTLSWDNSSTPITQFKNKLKLPTNNIPLTGAAIASSGLTPTYTVTQGTDVVEISTIDGVQKLRGLKAGKYKITASQSGDSHYTAAASIESEEFEIPLAQPDLKIDYPIIKTIPYGTNTQGMTASPNVTSAEHQSGAITYSSSNTSVATVNSSTGTITPVKTGKFYFQANVAATDYWASDARSTEVEIVPADPTLTWSAPTDVHYGDRVTLSDPTSSPTLPTYSYSYTSDNTYTTISGNQLDATKPTTSNINITATLAANSDYNNSASTTETIAISKTDQAIVWSQTLSKQPAGIFTNAIEIPLTAYSVDTRHSTGGTYSGVATYLTIDGNEVKTGLAISYTVEFTPDGSCQESDFVYTVENCTLKITKAVAGSVKIIANCTDANGNYNNASQVEKTFQIDRVTPTITANVSGGNTITYTSTKDAFTLTATAAASDNNNIYTATSGFTYTITSGSDVAQLNGDKLTTLMAGTVTVQATNTQDCYFNATNTSFTITVNLADPQLQFTSTISSLKHTETGKSVTAASTANPASTGTITYTSSDESVATVDNSGNISTVKVGTFTVTAHIKADDKYFADDEVSATITVDKCDVNNLAITGNNSMVCFNTQKLNYTTNNTEGHSLTWSSSDESVLTVASDGTVTAKHIGTATVTLTLAATTSFEEQTCALSITVTKGVLEFVGTTDTDWWKAGNWNHKVVPDATNDVLIKHDCVIASGNGNALCDCLSFDNTTYKLTINPDAVLVAAGDITSAATNLYLNANDQHQATVLFNGGTANATVQAYLKGSIDPVIVNGVTYNNPDWQYRGFIGENASFNWSNVMIYQWHEENNASNCWYTDNNKTPWYNKSGQKTGEAWNGFCMANYSTTDHLYTYTTQLIPTVAEQGQTYMHQYTLSKTTTGTGDANAANCGVNLITNSWSAPIDMNSTAISYTGDVEHTFTFYRTSNHNDYENNSTSMIVTYPDLSGAAANPGVSQYIPSGQSFLVKVKTGTTGTLTINPGALKNQASGAMYAPRQTESFNVLGIYISNGTDIDYLALLENDHCSANFDNGYDGTKMFQSSMPQIYATNDFGSTAVNTDSTILGQRIGYRASKDGEICTITFNTERLTNFEELYLYDRITHKYTDILAGNSYSFDGTKDGDDARFEIVGRRDDGTEYVTSQDRMIEVIDNRALLSGFTGSGETLFITDLKGNRLWTANANDGPWFDLPDLPAGMYVIYCGKTSAKFVRK